MEYSLKLMELINRPIIRNDKSCEFLNKMTDEEIKTWEKEIEQNLIEEGVPQKFPEWNAAFLAKEIDYEIMYEIFKD